jgi:16S rRNA (guanine966-N2)-methyltransferase
MRIIAGEFRGRRLVAPRGLETRPTTDRVREAWFSILGPPGPRVLDLFAGTGALGFEALSRGAERAYFVEKARPAAEAIRKNAAALGVLARVVVIESDVARSRRVLEREAPFDLIVADPPWTALEQSERALQAILTPDLLSPHGVLVLGHPKGRPIVPSSLSDWPIDKSRTWGDSAATFFGRPES